jgi:hypothetical protein
MATSIVPDPKAQEIAEAVSRNADALSELVDSIPQTTVNGPETRQELLEANGHIVQAIAWLQRTADREVPRCERLEQEFPDNVVPFPRR